MSCGKRAPVGLTVSGLFCLLACTEQERGTRSASDLPDPATQKTKTQSSGLAAVPQSGDATPHEKSPSKRGEQVEGPPAEETRQGQTPDPQTPQATTSKPRTPESKTPSSQTKKSDKPRSEAECKSTCRGEWKVHGLADEPSCNCRTTDAGKRCKDADQCEGSCILEEGKTEVTDPGPPPRGFFLGRCSEFVTAFGCHVLLPGGMLERGPQVLDRPPPKLCID